MYSLPNLDDLVNKVRERFLNRYGERIANKEYAADFSFDGEFQSLWSAYEAVYLKVGHALTSHGGDQGELTLTYIQVIVKGGLTSFQLRSNMCMLCETNQLIKRIV